MSSARLLHLPGASWTAAAQRRVAGLIAGLGHGVEHTVADGTVSRAGGSDAVQELPPLTGFPFPRRLLRIARAMLGYDLVLTYGNGAMPAVIAHTLFEQALRLPPLVHHEDAAQPWTARQNWVRRIALAGVQALVVPSERLETIARQDWQLPRRKVHRIAPGVPVARYGQRCQPDALPRVVKRAGELWLGTIAPPPLAAAAHSDPIAGLLEPLAALPPEWQLVVLGEAANRDAIRMRAVELGIGHRVHLPGPVADLAEVLGLLDLFVLPPASARAISAAASLCVIEAMAAGLAIVSASDDDIAALVAAENREPIAVAHSGPGLAAALAELAADPARRTAIGAANQARALAEYDEARMISACREVYASVIGGKGLP